MPFIVEPATATGAGAGVAAPVLLGVEGLVAGYGGGDVLRGVDLAVPKGSITCIVGPNGAGKSTLLATISGMLRPRKGKIVFDGRDLVGCPPKEVLSAGIVLVPQNHSLFRHMTVRENVELGGFTLGDKGLVRERRKAVEDIFPIVAERGPRKSGQPVRGPAAVSGVRPQPDARPAAGGARRAVYGPRPKDEKDGVPDRAPDERGRPDHSARRAERPGCSSP